MYTLYDGIILQLSHLNKTAKMALDQSPDFLRGPKPTFFGARRILKNFFMSLKFKFKHIQTSIEKQVLTTYTNLSQPHQYLR